MIENFSLEQITFGTYIIVFLFGVFICFTPCVYPIMPIVIGYIGASDIKSKKEAFFRSLSYVLGMASVYAFLGAAAALTGGIFGTFQSSFWVNLIVANIFIVMGLFMLDIFKMPQIAFFDAEKIKKRKGMGGAFLTGLVSGLVIGPCITPVLGAILAYVAAKQNIFLGVSLLFVYAFGMGMPLLLLGTFIGIMKKMPKSGEWMVKVKKIFGLLLIGVGEYFLLIN